MQRQVHACIALSLSLAACSSDSSGDTPDGFLDTLEPGTFASPEDAKKWSTASAPKLISLAVLPYTAADLQVQINMDTCPAKSVNGTTSTYTGGCTDSKGKAWVGTATLVEEADGSGGYTYDGFGFTGMQDCMGTMYPSSLSIDGTLVMTTSGDLGEFEINIEESTEGVQSSDCSPRADMLAVDYAGTVLATGADADGDGELDDELFNGTGWLGSMTMGVAKATTKDELVSDAACMDEAASGTTTVEADGHTMVITYDGATDCDEDSTVNWTYDGVAQGELTGVDCSAGRNGGSAAVLVVLAGAFAMRRRRRQR